MKIKQILFFMVVLYLICLGACEKDSSDQDLPTTPETPSKPQVNDYAIDFTAKDRNNNDVSLSDYYGQVILINFSSDTCGPCRDEAPHLEVLYNEYKSRGFQVITLLIGGWPSSWADLWGLTFPVLDDNNRIIWNVYGEGYIPLNIIVDRNRVIRYKKAGYYESEIKAIIEQYL